MIFSAYIKCPESYLCDASQLTAVRQCVTKDHVCDGSFDCPAKDDEVQCGRFRRLILCFIWSSDVTSLLVYTQCFCVFCVLANKY